MSVIPAALPSDSSDVADALDVARALFEKGQLEDAIRWVRNAIDAADHAGDALRVAALARTVAELADRSRASAAPSPAVQPAPPPSPPPQQAAPPQPPPLPPPTPQPSVLPSDTGGSRPISVVARSASAAPPLPPISAPPITPRVHVPSVPPAQVSPSAAPTPSSIGSSSTPAAGTASAAPAPTPVSPSVT